jgi:hypothetical protein
MLLRVRGHGVDMRLAATAMIMIPVSAIAAFTVKWWLAFIPLGNRLCDGRPYYLQDHPHV